ncbi:uncharacterized protein [Apostichopus japonicus]|uniref:uncharacterized protein n=1 Tax=Stichopus japonicus TaxID=307972 RepID=UPI003AB1A7C6
MAVLRCVILALVFCTVAIVAAPMEDETFDDALVRRGFLKHLFHRFRHGKPAANEPGKRDFAGDDGEDKDALLDDLEEKMAALNPEGFDELTPEEKSLWHSLVHHANNAIHALGK